MFLGWARGERGHGGCDGLGVLLTGVPLSFSLPGGDRTVFVSQHDLFHLTDL